MESKNASLLYASSIGELSFIKILFVDGVDVDTKDKDGNSAIHEAAKTNQVEAIKLLLQNGADIDAINNNGNSALHAAIMATSFECVEYLLISGIKVNRFNNKKESELLCAMQLEVDEALKEKTEKIIELLIENGNIDLKAETGDSVAMFDGSNYLFKAILCGNDFAAEKLIEKDITLCETKNKKGNYPIHFAATNNELTCVRLIISKNTNYINIEGKCGNTPLECAVYNACFSVIEYLIEQNADVNLQSNEGYSPLYWATYGYSNCCMTKDTVCKFTEKLKNATNFQEKVVTFRKKCAYLAIAAFLIENGGANIYLQSKNGETVFDLIKTEKDIVKILKMMFLHKPLNDKINSLTNELRSLQVENNQLKERMNQFENEIKK